MPALQSNVAAWLAIDSFVMPAGRQSTGWISTSSTVRGGRCTMHDVIMKSGHGRTNYALYVNREIVGLVRAKPKGVPLSGMAGGSALRNRNLHRR